MPDYNLNWTERSSVLLAGQWPLHVYPWNRYYTQICLIGPHKVLFFFASHQTGLDTRSMTLKLAYSGLFNFGTATNLREGKI